MLMACYLKEVGQMMTMNKQLTKKLRRKKKETKLGKRKRGEVSDEEENKL